MTPFQQILGAAFDNLPVSVQALHALSSSAHTSGREPKSPQQPIPPHGCSAGLPRLTGESANRSSFILSNASAGLPERLLQISRN